MWHGKLIGALLGMLFTHSPWGMVIGIIAGHYFDTQAMRGLSGGSSANAHEIQDAFFRATFRVMGHIAKADGRVSEEEIRAARAVMAQFRLGEAEVRWAIELFTEGKAADFPLNDSMVQLGNVLRNRPDLRRMFVQIQLQTALLGDGMHPQARSMMLRVCQALGVSEFELAQMEAILRMQRAGQTYGPGQGGQGYGQPRSSRDTLQEAYNVLGVTPQASDGEITKAYRRLMSQNHPDKLAAKGLPESMKTVAEEKTKQIRAAYEAIKEARGMK